MLVIGKIMVHPWTGDRCTIAFWPCVFRLKIGGPGFCMAQDPSNATTSPIERDVHIVLLYNIHDLVRTCIDPAFPRAHNPRDLFGPLLKTAFPSRCSAAYDISVNDVPFPEEYFEILSGSLSASFDRVRAGSSVKHTYSVKSRASH